jgi:hypothetical protein
MMWKSKTGNAHCHKISVEQYQCHRPAESPRFVLLFKNMRLALRIAKDTHAAVEAPL